MFGSRSSPLEAGGRAGTETPPPAEGEPLYVLVLQRRRAQAQPPARRANSERSKNSREINTPKIEDVFKHPRVKVDGLCETHTAQSSIIIVAEPRVCLPACLPAFCLKLHSWPPRSLRPTRPHQLVSAWQSEVEEEHSLFCHIQPLSSTSATTVARRFKNKNPTDTHSSLCSQIRHPANKTKLQQIHRASAEGKEKE